jgi:acetyl esterase/lipase
VLVPLSQATSYAKRLSELGAPHELHVVEGGLHGFDRVAPGDEARSLIERSREFLKWNLGSSS